jgi:hypothetical protein
MNYQIVSQVGMGILLISILTFVISTAYAKQAPPDNKEQPSNVVIPPGAYLSETGTIVQKAVDNKPAGNCYPGCERRPVPPGEEDPKTWRCSRKSMYEGGKDGGLCDSQTECTGKNPSCCCYDRNCSGCGLSL